MSTVSAATELAGERLVCQAVSHEFDGNPVLYDISITIELGEVLALIGPSGTGKSTLLRIMAMFLRPDAGSVHVGDKNVWTLDDEEYLATRRRVGMVFQEANLFDASVQQNVSYGLKVRKGWRDRIRESLPIGMNDSSTVNDQLQLVDMVDAKNRDVHELSEGEAQRVAFARAMAYDPDFLLLDEPTSNLDPRNTAVIEEAVQAAREAGLAVVIATHDMHQAERLADRVAVMINGRLIEVGPSERVFSTPNDPRAKQFINGELVY